MAAQNVGVPHEMLDVKPARDPSASAWPPYRAQRLRDPLVSTASQNDAVTQLIALGTASFVAIRVHVESS